MKNMGASPDGDRATHEPSLGSRPLRVSVPSAEKREGLCELCGRSYRVWAAASPLWNAVVRGGSINGDEEHAYLCADCFMGLAEDRGIASLFQVRAEQTIPLETVTPSGRVWDDAGFRFQ